jgi:hypothetical protein
MRQVSRPESRTTAAQAIAGKDRPNTVAVLNLLKAADQLTAKGAHKGHYLVSVGHRAEQLVLTFEDADGATRVFS